MVKMIFLCLVVFFYFGCHDQKLTKLEIGKNGEITIDHVDDIIQRYVSYSMPESSIKNIIAYDKVNSTYRLGFHINNKENNPSDTSHFRISLINYDLCSVGKKEYNSNEGDYAPFVSFGDSHVEKSIYITKERLVDRGMITVDPNRQEDICIYTKFVSKSMTTIETIESNVITYTAAEINAVVSEYERLSGKSR